MRRKPACATQSKKGRKECKEAPPRAFPMGESRRALMGSFPRNRCRYSNFEDKTANPLARPTIAQEPVGKLSRPSLASQGELSELTDQEVPATGGADCGCVSGRIPEQPGDADTFSQGKAEGSPSARGDIAPPDCIADRRHSGSCFVGRRYSRRRNAVASNPRWKAGN